MKKKPGAPRGSNLPALPGDAEFSAPSRLFDGIEALRQARAKVLANPKAALHSLAKVFKNLGPVAATVAFGPLAGAAAAGIGGLASDVSDESYFQRFLSDVLGVFKKQSERVPPKSETADHFIDATSRVWRLLRERRSGPERFELIRRIAVAGFGDRACDNGTSEWKRAMGALVTMERVMDLQLSHAVVLGHMLEIERVLRVKLNEHFQSQWKRGVGLEIAAQGTGNSAKGILTGVIQDVCHLTEYEAITAIAEMEKAHLIRLPGIKVATPQDSLDKYRIVGSAGSDLVWFLARYEEVYAPLLKTLEDDPEGAGD